MAIVVNANTHQHRHGLAITRALERVKKVTASDINSSEWTYHGEKIGVKIYSRETLPPDDINFPNEPHQDLPLFRGDGWISGGWRVDDVLATVINLS